MIKIVKQLFLLTNIIVVFIFAASCETSTEYKREAITYNQALDKNNKATKKNNTYNISQENLADHSEILNIGLLLPLSGKYYQIGKSLLNSAQLALDRTGNDRVIFHVVDTGNNEELLQNLYNIISKELDIVVGPVFSENIIKVSQMLKDNNITTITLSNNSDMQTNKFFVSGITLEDEITELFDYSYNNGLKRFAVIIPDSQYGKKVKKKIEEIKSSNDFLEIEYAFYQPSQPNYYEVTKKISNYEKRKLELDDKIKILKSLNSKEAEDELKILEKRDTLGNPNFEAIAILTQNFNELSNFSTILPYYDVDPNEIQYIGNSVWYKEQAIKEPGLQNGYFTSLNIDTKKNFDEDYFYFFNKKPHPLASLSYDMIGLICKLHLENKNFKSDMLLTQAGFIGVNGLFKFEKNGKVSRKPKIYRIKKHGFKLIN